MKCNYCGEEIYENENFYIIDGEIFCSECCKENTHTYYTVCDNAYEEDEVVHFDTKEEAIMYYKKDIAALEYGIAEMEKLNVPWKDAYIELHKFRIKKTQDLLKSLKDEKKEDIYMWKCKKCGGEINVKANIQGFYRVYLNKNKKIINCDDCEELYLPNGEIIVAICDECSNRCSTIDNLEEIAVWEEAK